MKSTRPLLILSLIVATIALDTLSKLYFSELLSDRTIPLISNIIMLHLVHNSWVAFSMPIQGIFLQVLTVLLLWGIIFYFIRYEYPKRSYLLDVGYALIIGGALSHAYERIVYGKVIDFIAVKYFAVLNFADIFISVGVFCILLSYFLHERYSHPHTTSSTRWE